MAVPTVRRRRLGAELRRLREESDFTLEEVEARSGISASKVSRIESATRGAKPDGVEQLLHLYGLKDSDIRDRLLRMARDGGRRGWWQTYDLSPVYSDLISLESDASSVRTYEPLVVPGLLQTSAYARAVIAAHGMTASPEDVDALVEVRMARQSVLTKPSPLRLWAIIHEAALLASVPGTGVMRDQLQRLLDVAVYPHVTIQILPLDAELHPGVTGGFTALGFGQPGLEVVLLENLESSLYVEEPANVARYAEAFERLTASALPFERSLSRITQLKEREK
ncbi:MULTISPECIES: helix-turn-helix domain-containing protein [Streptomyces]|uniref:Helix-turn-helix domain-containing protein n=1 Tax=Streptomyces griseocarneus TaxID=51201 RepID=A0ABX7RUV2_9ACTN|nr:MULTISPECIES: helix-turn-helix transcriptional regulator [Streptomyces]QSY50681.1 helix-turn-helix domain-containing protein [Streptomyces griseocarneus]